MVRVALLFAAGTNCDAEMAHAFRLSGARVEYLHINQAKAKPERRRRYQILGIPGGFTYGDYISAGRILANELRFSLREELLRFITCGKLIIGICNGFQVMVKAGLLPALDGYLGKQTATLVTNDSGRFECRWVYLQIEPSKCVFTRGLEGKIYLPVAHAEGKFVTKSSRVLAQIKRKGLAVLRYALPDKDDAAYLCGPTFPLTKPRRAGTNCPLPYPWNPNGSSFDIAGICDPSGRLLGMMPHPERFVRPTQHPRWTREKIARCDGLLIYQNAVNYARQNL
ncbi:MAG: phosphoribosylformylglycinamidine synthase subunit PurQ [candidate division WOR-3 bacterium]